ncbi:MAG: AbrB/MazE/SpoVT family DNA-binding domain-containing protein [Trichlorobacter sp.]|nr:AbrB/MazE/SpoVT family DNA-binding domain-containing protein [Trichlorobacter sp.]
MLITVDQRGSVSLPAFIRKELGLAAGTCLDLTVEDGGALLLRPVAIYPALHLSANGLDKLAEARNGDTGQLPDWLQKEMDDAGTDPQ